MSNFFLGREILVASKHKKEKVIEPILKKIELTCFVNSDIDTDMFGTFTGEIERVGNSLENAMKKVSLSNELTGHTLILASEGSFSAHPMMPFVMANEEILLLKDYENNIEIISKFISLETNFSSTIVNNIDELLLFASKIKFPSHGIILKGIDTNEIFKGITEKAVLMEKYRILKKTNMTIVAESDMRAMYNPTRMKNIEKCAEKLVEKMLSLCPHCETPGFDIVELAKGLPCSWCGLPTKSIKSYKYKCQKCSYEKIVEFPFDKEEEDPQYCDYCNP